MYKAYSFFIYILLLVLCRLLLMYANVPQILVREWLRAADNCCGTVGAGRWSSFEQFSVENSQIN